MSLATLSCDLWQNEHWRVSCERPDCIVRSFDLIAAKGSECAESSTHATILAFQVFL